MWIRASISLCVGLFAAAVVGAQEGAQEKERDIANYAAQKNAPEGTRRIVIVAAEGNHGSRGTHEFLAAAVYLARTINAAYPKAYAVVYPGKQWPKDLSQADAVVVLLNHGRSAINPAMKDAMARGAGFMAIHYGVEVEKGEKGGDYYLQWMGGYFETFWSVNPTWTASFTKIPEHETTRGVKPFEMHDEWYYHMRFVEGMKGVTPILSALPKLETIKGGGKEKLPHNGNPNAYADVSAGNPQHTAWAYVRPDQARGFGYTGLHYHKNLGNDNARTLLLNAVAWVAKLEVPSAGVPNTPLSPQDLDQLIDDGKRLAQ